MQVESKIMEQVKSVLSGFGNKYIDSNGALKRNKVIEDLDHYDRNLMTALLANQQIHDQYTEKVADTEIFKLNQFLDVFEYKEFWEDSFTKYANRIGLTTDGRFISDSEDVVLDFPYKDTVLKASMSKEDADSEVGANEPFLNETLSHSEISELFEPKVLVNAKRYDKDGEHKAAKFHDDNLVIKGNNLIALHSIKKKYAGKVKLIYLDPPYNTGSDSFKYNDRFSHATWLTFMKSRLEIAKILMANDGVIAIQMDDSEGPYLKVLADSIFGRDNELFTQYVLVRYANKTLKSDMDYHKQIEQIHYYKKNSNIEIKPNKDKVPYDYSKFCYEISTIGSPVSSLKLGNKRVDIFSKGQVKFNKVTGNPNGLKEIWASGTILNGNSSGRFFRDYLDGRYKKDGYGVTYKVYDIGDDGNEYRFFTGPKKAGATKGKYYQGVPLDVKNGKISQKFLPIPGFIDMAGSFGNDRLEGGVELRNGKKPERLLQSIIKYFSNKNDYVMDFFAGSGSTLATAMKMDRKFIGVEQINDQVLKINERLNNVIDGDQTGISKDVNWQGGGSFVYAELMEKNMDYLKDLEKATTIDELSSVYQRMKQGADYDFRVDLNRYENDPERKTMSFEDQKKLLIKMLNKNQLYFNEDNIDDADVRDLISDSDYQFNKSFYGKGNA
ncbi:MAG TPA: site-specific DNA-methyltransferase [Candidatus Limosilactobacillus intestinavium]|nr:site-specific DNA-methyltransferase [Candidatus Limosilactobacillus intestinavium]